MKDSRPSDIVYLSVLLGLAAAGCGLLYGLRVLISGRYYYLFLLWNLFLAFVPYVVAAGASELERRLGERRGRALMLGPLLILWLLFYPNAPYIFTDFIHVIEKSFLRQSPTEWLGLKAFLWYDIAMTAAFAFIGHFIGLVSMWLVQRTAQALWGAAVARFLMVSAILLSGFGIYLGRFSRLNSWDIVSMPGRVVMEFFEAAIEPKAILFSLTFALFVGLSYGALIAFKRLGRD